MVEKLAEMTVDEFFEHGFDSENEDELVENEEELVENVEEVVENEELEGNTKKEKLEKKGKKTKSVSNAMKHKSQLDDLKKKDPEFYKFLQENDEELLAFSASDDDDDNADDSDDDEDNKTLDKDEFSADEPSDDDEPSGEDTELCDQDDFSDKETKQDEDDTDGPEGVQNEAKGKYVSENMIKRWNTGLEENSLKSLKFVLHAFHAAVESMSPEEDEKKKDKRRSKYIVKSASMYNNLMKMCLKHSVNVLEKNLSSAKKKKFNSTYRPSSHKLWSSIKTPLKQYLLDILQLLRVHTDVSVLTILLRHCQGLSPYIACYPKTSKMLLKRLIRMWCSGEEHVRVIAFLCIRTLTLLIPNLFEYVLKKLYLGFVRNSKFVNLKTKPVITFMKNSLVEMFGHNQSATYKHGFLYIRQLAITLRNAITIKKKDSLKSVYNWQYMSCLQLWSQVVSDLNGDVLKPLIYPIVQINLGVIKLIPSARYYPLRFHCIQSLNYMSKKTGVYIPTASYVLEALESNGFLQRAKSSEKAPDFAGVLKVSKSQLHSKAFQDCTIDLAVEALLEHYVIFSHSIAFPELIFPVSRRLKQFIKNSKAYKPCQDMKMLVEKLQLHADIIQRARDEVTFSPKELEQVKKWEEERKSMVNNLSVFLETWKKMKSLTDTCQSLPEHTEKMQSTGGGEKSKNGKSSAEKKRKSNTDNNTNVSTTKKRKKRTEEQRQFDDDNDIVEEYKLSEDED